MNDLCSKKWVNYKHKAEKFAGLYQCQVDYYYFDITPMIVDTTYIDTLEVQRDGVNLYLFNRSIPVDSVRKENEYKEFELHDQFTLQFIDDSIYVYLSSGGLGGNASYTYAGKKI
ncbi:MAG: hypothetical protein IPH66_11140 [Crocinitomicaceae bacterium]|nr:hypothetical protein [Crocinitomicaceae bacterium]